jgi:DNA-binding transcriptional ArsR family regulator
MATVTELLRHFIQAISDPTRGAILGELHHAGELTPTQLARRLGLTANNVYHHMRVLRKLGIVDPPRVVPRETYVEKYYSIAPDMLAILGRDPVWFDRVGATLTAEDRKELLIAMCLTMSQLLQRAARRYGSMDPEALEDLFSRRGLGMLSINEMSMERLEARLSSLRAIQSDEHEAGLDQPDPNNLPQHVVLMAGLPLLWGDVRESDTAEPPGGGADETTQP